MKTTAEKTSPSDAVRESAQRNEIVHVVCEDNAAALNYAKVTEGYLTDSDRFGSLGSEIEIVGDLDGSPVRVHVSVAE